LKERCERCLPKWESFSAGGSLMSLKSIERAHSCAVILISSTASL
jgi:hypothetical protein